MLEGRTPGLLNVPGVGPIQFDQWTEDWMYDRISLTIDSAIAVGTEYEFFTSLTNKNKADTNMTEEQKLPQGWSMIVQKMGLWIPGKSADATNADLPKTDFCNIVENSYIRFETGNQKIRRQAPTWAWPCGLGMTGMKAQDETASGPIVRNVLNIGAPTLGAVTPLLVPIRLTNQMPFKAIIRFEVATTPTEIDQIFFGLYGLISRPLQ